MLGLSPHPILPRATSASTGQAPRRHGLRLWPPEAMAVVTWASSPASPAVESSSPNLCAAAAGSANARCPGSPGAAAWAASARLTVQYETGPTLRTHTRKGAASGSEAGCSDWPSSASRSDQATKPGARSLRKPSTSAKRSDVHVGARGSRAPGCLTPQPNCIGRRMPPAPNGLSTPPNTTRPCTRSPTPERLMDPTREAKDIPGPTANIICHMCINYGVSATPLRGETRASQGCMPSARDLSSLPHGSCFVSNTCVRSGLLGR